MDRNGIRCLEGVSFPRRLEGDLLGGLLFSRPLLIGESEALSKRPSEPDSALLSESLQDQQRELP